MLLLYIRYKLLMNSAYLTCTVIAFNAFKTPTKQVLIEFILMI